MKKTCFAILFGLLTAMTAPAAEPLLRLGADEAGRNLGTFPAAVNVGPNAALASSDGAGMTLGPLAEDDTTGGVAIAAAPELSSGQFTITAWLRLQSGGYAGLGVCLYDKLAAAAGKGVQINLSFNERAAMRVFAVVGKETRNSAFFSEKIRGHRIGGWSFIALRFDGGTLRASLGDLAGNLETVPELRFAPGNGNAPEAPITLGYRANSKNRALKGNLADFRLYSGLLSDAELAAIQQNRPAAATVGQSLPKVLLIGDSIRMGYQAPLADKLRTAARVLWPAENCEDSAHIRRRLDAYLAEYEPGLVYLNCGLHDIKTNRASRIAQVPPAQYQENLRAIVARLKAAGVKVIYCTTTPVIDERHNRTLGFDRRDATVRAYNEAAVAIMRENAIPVVDFHALIDDRKMEFIRSDGVHMEPPASELLAAESARAILKTLQ